ncbi:MAG: hypothetical protein WCF90_10430, partial [Methanomicrobiales archaeon]
YILMDINEKWITGSRYLAAKSEMISLESEASDFTAIQRHYFFFLFTISLSLLPVKNLMMLV